MFLHPEAVQAGKLARELVVSLPGFLPLRYTELKEIVRRNFQERSVLQPSGKRIPLTDHFSLAHGTLVTYGILMRNSGNVRS
ncbi:hypothetical protein AVEN_270894-1 [Araneus ventricosus]|uniref:Uncharacterized protein n=1 Tax=Araneus ventricosus TaxID=182803 RepID=A0A4Y2T2E1_ARAVE|nr:hypothetical protein AVEN_270894-1 [Araneus ventricosus]